MFFSIPVSLSAEEVLQLQGIIMRHKNVAATGVRIWQMTVSGGRISPKRISNSEILTNLIKLSAFLVVL